MRMRYEVWCYSKSWGKWIRDVYPKIEDAQARYEYLKSNGRKVKPPQPVNSSISIFSRMTPMNKGPLISMTALIMAAITGVSLTVFFKGHGFLF